MVRRAILPDLEFDIGLSEKMLAVSGQSRYWNVVARESIDEALKQHHRKVIPRHFRRGAFGRYGYKPRDPEYRKKKKRGGFGRPGVERDLIMSGAPDHGRLMRMVTKTRKTKYQGHAAGGTAGKGTFQLKTLTAILWMGRFTDVGIPYSDTGAGVTPRDMKQEIAATIPPEQRDIAQNYFLGITKRINRFGGGIKRRIHGRGRK